MGSQLKKQLSARHCYLATRRRLVNVLASNCVFLTVPSVVFYPSTVVCTTCGGLKKRNRNESAFFTC